MELHLASMENVSCWAFRKLFPGATDSYTGVLSLNYLLRRKTWNESDLFPINGQKQWFQIATSKEEECKKFVERLVRENKQNPEAYSFYGIQLNLSSPSRHLTNIGLGPALIRRTEKVVSLVNELLKQDIFKVSIKTRLGLGEEDVMQGKVFLLMQKFEEIRQDNQNLSEVVVHFKHAREPSYTSYNYSSLGRISEYDIPLVINGGIKNYNDFKRITGNITPEKKKNIVGFMMGREALRNPDCFIDSSNLLNKTSFKKRTPEQVKQEFEENCKAHIPKESYIKKIAKLCPSWASNLNINFPKDPAEKKE